MLCLYLHVMRHLLDSLNDDLSMTLLHVQGVQNEGHGFYLMSLAQNHWHLTFFVISTFKCEN